MHVHVIIDDVSFFMMVKSLSPKLRLPKSLRGNQLEYGTGVNLIIAFEKNVQCIFRFLHG